MVIFVGDVDMPCADLTKTLLLRGVITRYLISKVGAYLVSSIRPIKSLYVKKSGSKPTTAP